MWCTLLQKVYALLRTGRGLLDNNERLSRERLLPIMKFVSPGTLAYSAFCWGFAGLTNVEMYG